MKTADDVRADAFDIPAAVLKRLVWYRRHATRARLGYQNLEFAQLITGALVPLAVAVHWPTAVPAGLGAAVVVLGGARAIFQWHDSWLGFIDAMIRIEREIALFQVQAPPYDGADRPAELVRRVEQISLDETRRWTVRRRSSAAEQPRETRTPV